RSRVVGLLTQKQGGRRPWRSRQRAPSYFVPSKGVFHVDRLDPADSPGPAAPGRPAHLGPQPQLGLRPQRRPGTAAGDRAGAGAHGAHLTNGSWTARAKGGDDVSEPQISSDVAVVSPHDLDTLTPPDGP